MANGSFLTGLPELMEWGLQGRALSRRHRLTLLAASALGLLALWSLAAGLVAVGQIFNPIFLPGPWLVLGAIGSLARSGQLWGHIAATLERVVIGFSTSAVLALGLGLLAGQLRGLRNAVEPVIELLRPIPPLAMLPLFIVWVGIGETSKISFITYTTFFPMFVAIGASILRVDVTLLRAAASLGATRRDLIRRVVLPAALPGIVVALRLGVGLALFVIVGAEFMGADAGLGHLIMEGRTFFNPAQIVMGALVLGLLGSLVNALLLAVERRVLQGHASA